MPSAALSSSESRMGLHGQPLQKPGGRRQGWTGSLARGRGGRCAVQADAGLLGTVTASRVRAFGADEQGCSACS